MLYPELEFLDRFAAAARDGFKAVEFLFPYAFEVREIAAQLETTACNRYCSTPRPAIGIAGKGIGVPAGAGEEFRAGINKALDYAEILQCPRIHVMAGLCQQAPRAKRYIRPISNNSVGRPLRPPSAASTY